jgi:hypothetical protein
MQHFLSQKSSKNSPRCQKKVDHLVQALYNKHINSKKEPKMTEFESKCYGMSEQDIRTQYMESITAKFSGLEMVVMGIMSDCQEMMAMGTGPGSVEYVRKQMNVAKFILSEMMEAKQAA